MNYTNGKNEKILHDIKVEFLNKLSKEEFYSIKDDFESIEVAILIGNRGQLSIGSKERNDIFNRNKVILERIFDKVNGNDKTNIDDLIKINDVLKNSYNF